MKRLSFVNDKAFHFLQQIPGVPNLDILFQRISPWKNELLLRSMRLENSRTSRKLTLYVPFLFPATG